MEFLPQIIFLAAFLIALFFIIRSIRTISYNINLGKPASRNDRKKDRWKNMALIALGQKKMFHRPVPAIMHLFIYLGFIIVNIEVLEIIIDGLFGTHRVFAPTLGVFYPWLINVFEFFAVAVIISCVVFLIRRDLIRLPRFRGEEMTSWPRIDANIILITEIFLMVAFLTMNASDRILQERLPYGYTQTGEFVFSSYIIPFIDFLPTTSLVYVERFTWWFHIIGILGFAVYIFHNSKHLHIFISFPNTFFAKLNPVGKWDNMDSVTREVNFMLGKSQPEDEDQSTPSQELLGAKDVTDLTWKNLMDAYTCTECGRCTNSCPANMTGKKLSPRKIIMDTRDRLEEAGENIRKNGKDHDDGKSLLGDYITTEELNACTTCAACVEACPVLIDPLDIIVQLRRYIAMEESKVFNPPAEWDNMYNNIQTSFAPWKFPPSDRFKWAEKLNE